MAPFREDGSRETASAAKAAVVGGAYGTTALRKLRVKSRALTEPLRKRLATSRSDVGWRRGRAVADGSAVPSIAFGHGMPCPY
jgi:hypothetical protein